MAELHSYFSSVDKLLVYEKWCIGIKAADKVFAISNDYGSTVVKFNFNQLNNYQVADNLYYRSRSKLGFVFGWLGITGIISIIIVILGGQIFAAGAFGFSMFICILLALFSSFAHDTEISGQQVTIYLDDLKNLVVTIYYDYNEKNG